MVPVYLTLFPSLIPHLSMTLGLDYLHAFRAHSAILVSALKTSFWCFGEALFPGFLWSPSQIVLLPWRLSQAEMLVLFYVGTLPLIDVICCQRLGFGCLRCLRGSGLLFPNLFSHRLSNPSSASMFSQRDLLVCSLADSEAYELTHYDFLYFGTHWTESYSFRSSCVRPLLLTSCLSIHQESLLDFHLGPFHWPSFVCLRFRTFLLWLNCQEEVSSNLLLMMLTAFILSLLFLEQLMSHRVQDLISLCFCDFHPPDGILLDFEFHQFEVYKLVAVIWEASAGCFGEYEVVGLESCLCSSSQFQMILCFFEMCFWYRFLIEQLVSRQFHSWLLGNLHHERRSYLELHLWLIGNILFPSALTLIYSDFQNPSKSFYFNQVVRNLIGFQLSDLSGHRLFFHLYR